MGVLSVLSCLFLLALGSFSNPFKQGPLVKICDTSNLTDGNHYINDHTLVQGPDGSWHLYGIFHAEPADAEHEILFVHAVTKQPDPAKWGQNPFIVPEPNDPKRIALKVNYSLGETHLWAPHILYDAPHKRWVMVFNAGGLPDHTQIKIAVSPDLYTWTRMPTHPVFEDICVTRDPMWLQWQDQWVVFYTRCESAIHLKSGVAYRTSKDLLTFSEPTMALTLDSTPPLINSGYTESPFVFQYGGVFYLTVCSYPIDYMHTSLYRASNPVNPFHYDPIPIAAYNAHAAEWVLINSASIFSGVNALPTVYMTAAGWGKGGVFMSNMTATELF